MPRIKGVSAAGDKNLKERWNLSVSKLAQLGLNRLAKFWGYTSASSLLEALGRGDIFLSRQPQTLAALLASKDLTALHDATEISVRRLKELLLGAAPTADELIDLEDALGISQEDLIKIYAPESYPEKKDLEQPNANRHP